MTVAAPFAQLAKRIEAGEHKALSGGISLVENRAEGFERLLEHVAHLSGKAHRIGVTGPPGAGKSTLVKVLTEGWLDQGLRVGVLAVDPSSPYTRGALLGDRIRLGDLAMRDGLFVRSMASRGSAGGLSNAASDAADLLDAHGCDRIVIETLGVGQQEIDIASSADTVVVVLVPESGDGIQAMKAGLMEAADVFVVNKADRPGADKLEKELAVMLSIRARLTGSLPGGAPTSTSTAGGVAGGEDPANRWATPVVRTSALNGDGVEDLDAALTDHRAWLVSTGTLDSVREERRAHRTREALRRQALRAADRIWEDSPGVFRGETPHAAARRLWQQVARTAQCNP